ncbi:hypothetical protein ACFW04_014022 [Cataglyphis niger]
MIPEFDALRHKLQEFLNACTYAVRNINPADEESLMQAILYTKLKGKAMPDFETRDIQTFEELKHQLETCYQTRQSTTHLQIEFNSLKQKLNKTAHTFRQVDLLAMKLYDSMIVREEHPAHSKRTIHEIIKKQALINFQIGLRDKLGVLRPLNVLNAEKNGHYGRDCRSRYALPKSERSPRINTINKYCRYCKKSGHNREESKENNKKPNEKFFESKRPPCQFKQNSESDSNSSMEEKNNSMKKTRPAAEYRVTHIKGAPRNQAKNELLLVTILMRQIKNKEIQMLYDSGSISLIKLKHLKDDTPIQEEKIAINNQKIKHAFYVVRDDISIEYEGILEIDFLRQHSVTCDYKYNQLKLGKAMLNLHPFNKIILKPRSETIIKTRTDQNRIGIVRAEKKAPGIYIGNCIVNAADYTCPVSVINTTDREVEMQTPLIALEEIESDTTSEMYTIHTGNNLKPKISRNARI